MNLKDVSTHYLLMEYYLISFTYIKSKKESNLYNIIKNELKKRKVLQ